MQRKILLSILPIVLFSVGKPLWASTDLLDLCWKKQAKNLENQYLKISYQAEISYFAHSMNPWQKQQAELDGQLSINQNEWHQSARFINEDGDTTHSKLFYSTVAIWDDDLLSSSMVKSSFWSGGKLKEIDRSDYEEQLFQTAQYSPVLLLNYFCHPQTEKSQTDHPHFITYQSTIYGSIVELIIDKKTQLVSEINRLSASEKDDQFYGLGDVKTVYRYTDYAPFKNIIIPTKIEIEKLNGKLLDVVQLKDYSTQKETTPLLHTPADYHIKEKPSTEPDISVEHYTKNIHLINLHHCGTRSLLVEFDDFLLVAESPLNSRNGELLLQEVKKIAPNKPIKYFVFGHFHPHYTGGIRPFIHAGAEIISRESDYDYITYLAEVPHTLQADKLALDPQVLKFKTMGKVMEIKDENNSGNEMIIYHIGEKSNHTADYLIYYFPKEKMIFEDDLVWLNDESTKENLNPMTTGFYHAVKELNLEVETIIQNWSVFDKTKSMKFDFKKLENIMND